MRPCRATGAAPQTPAVSGFPDSEDPGPFRRGQREIDLAVIQAPQALQAQVPAVLAQGDDAQIFDDGFPGPRRSQRQPAVVVVGDVRAADAESRVEGRSRGRAEGLQGQGALGAPAVGEGPGRGPELEGSPLAGGAAVSPGVVRRDAQLAAGEGWFAGKFPPEVQHAAGKGVPSQIAGPRRLFDLAAGDPQGVQQVFPVVLEEKDPRRLAVEEPAAVHDADGDRRGVPPLRRIDPSVDLHRDRGLRRGQGKARRRLSGGFEFQHPAADLRGGEHPLDQFQSGDPVPGQIRIFPECPGQDVELEIFGDPFLHRQTEVRRPDLDAVHVERHVHVAPRQGEQTPPVRLEKVFGDQALKVDAAAAPAVFGLHLDLHDLLDVPGGVDQHLPVVFGAREERQRHEMGFPGVLGAVPPADGPEEKAQRAAVDVVVVGGQRPAERTCRCGFRPVAHAVLPPRGGPFEALRANDRFPGGPVESPVEIRLEIRASRRQGGEQRNDEEPTAYGHDVSPVYIFSDHRQL